MTEKYSSEYKTIVDMSSNDIQRRKKNTGKKDEQNKSKSSFFSLFCTCFASSEDKNSKIKAKYESNSLHELHIKRKSIPNSHTNINPLASIEKSNGKAEELNKNKESARKSRIKLDNVCYENDITMKSFTILKK